MAQGATFENIFGPYLADEALRAQFQGAAVEHMEVHRQAGTMLVTVRLPRFVDAAALFAADNRP